ncbi:MAG: hypothetical protein KIC80_07495 [Brachyspira sp.]|nr:hypothetical protein [Brachyspira sp.]
MDLKNLKKPVIITGYAILALYILFLVIPFAVSPFVNSYSHYLSKVIEDACGFKIKFENVKLVTTPKLTAGVKAAHISVITPDNDELLTTDNAQVKISLIPLLIKKLEIDFAGADDISAEFKLKKNGSFLLEEYFNKNTPEDNAALQSPASALPMGFKLSNHLPDIKIRHYKIAFVDLNDKKQYSVEGEKLTVSDFVLNKKIKLNAQGKITLAGAEQFNYNIKVFNRIMPELDLNELVFAEQNNGNRNKKQENPINILEVFKSINKNQLSANLKTDIKTSGTINNPHFDGLLTLDNISMAIDGKKLPEGHFNIDFKGRQILLNSELFTSPEEKTSITGDFKTGKKAHFNAAFKSNAGINNIFKIINTIAQSFNYNDLETLTASGAIDADFSIKSDLKNINSQGYFKIPSARVKYALYNVLIDNIKADIDLADGGINVKNAGFTILSQPLKIYGTIKNDTSTDMHLSADNLLLKGLATAAGQTRLLKDNNIKSGTLSAKASLTGTFKKLKPTLNLSLNNINVLNKPSSTSLKLKDTKFNIICENDSYKGVINLDRATLINPAVSVSLPSARVTLDTKDINIDDTYLTLNNSRIDIYGKISDYTGKKPDIDVKAKGAILASDIKSLIPKDFRNEIKANGKLPLLVTVTGNDKTQNIDIQLLAAPSNYVSVINIDKLNGKSTLLNSSIKISNDSIKLSDTGLYVVNGSTSLSDNVRSNMAGSSNLISIKGSVDNISKNPRLNNVNVKSAEMIAASIPGFKNSKINTQFELTLNGSPSSPEMKGFANIPSLSIPEIKTNLKNMTVDITNNAITIDTPAINIDNSVMAAKTIVSPNFSSGIVINTIDYNALLLDTDTLLKAMEGMPSQKPVQSTKTQSTSSASDIGVVIQNGKGSIAKFKSGNLTASDLSGDFSLKNNIFYLKGLKGSAYNGKINGEVSVNLINGKTDVDFHGSGLNAENAIYGAAGLKNALSGTLSFNAKLSLNGYAQNQNDMMKSLSGNTDFKIINGEFGNIGRFENMLFAQNIISNGVMGALVSPIANMPVVKNSAEFKSISGDMSFSNGWAKIKSIKTSGPSMAYFITGQYNLINTSANLIILGRLGADVVAALGPIGELTVSRLTSYIPKFGNLTGNIINAMTTDPKTENTAEIPALSNGSRNYKDFKVTFNGGIESKSSVKSFKWLSVCDTSEIENGSLKEQLEASRQNMQQLRKEQIEDVKQSVEDVKNSAKQTAEELKIQLQNTKDSLNGLKNLFKNPAEETEVHN